MRKIAFILLVALIFLSILMGCDDSFYTITYPEPVIVHPDNETANTINGYREKFPVTSEAASEDKLSETSDTKPSSSESGLSEYSGSVDENTLYYANKTTKKFHLKTCRYAKNMDKNKLLVIGNYSEAVNMGYSPCKVCQKK